MHALLTPEKRDGHRVRRASVLCGRAPNIMNALFKKEHLLGQVRENVGCKDHHNELWCNPQNNQAEGARNFVLGEATERPECRPRSKPVRS
jgi:hypothetical protein